jgi:hypothetical protein
MILNQVSLPSVTRPASWEPEEMPASAVVMAKVIVVAALVEA